MTRDSLPPEQRRRNARRMAFLLMTLALMFYAGIFFMTAIYR